jgi:hypothetical protein
MKWWFGCCVVLAVGCGSPAADSVDRLTPRLRKTVVWVGEAIDEDSSASLKRAGVDLLVVRWGSVDLTTGSPVIKINSAPEIAGEIPVSAALRVESGSAELKQEAASALWRGLEPIIGDTTAEIVLDVPTLSPGIPDFIRALDQVSGLPVVPILTVNQIRTSNGMATAIAAGTIIVPLYGPGAVGLRGVSELKTKPLAERLGPLAATSVRVRAGIVLTPRTEPQLTEMGDGLDVLCENGHVEINTSSKLDRAFIFRKPIDWNGRRWQAGDIFELRWMDAIRMNSALRELNTIGCPEVAGWDLVTLPSSGGSLGIDRRALLAYQEGKGPEPKLEVELERQGRTLRVAVVNTGPFTSVVSGHGNWLEVALKSGYLVAKNAGSFDRIVVGKKVGNRWRPGIGSGVNAVRYSETFLGPNEVLKTGSIRLPSSRSKVTVRWSIKLSDGTTVSGQMGG